MITHTVFTNTTCEEKKKPQVLGAGRSSDSAAGHIGPCLCQLQCPGCLAFAAEPNTEPTTSGREQVHPGTGPGPGWPAGHMPIQARPGPRPNLPWPNKAASELQGGTHRGGGLRAQGSGEDTNQGRDTQGTRIWISAEAAAAAGRGTRRWRHHPGKQTHTGLSLTDFVSVDTGNANRESTEVGMQEYLKSSDRQVQTKVLTEDAP